MTYRVYWYSNPCYDDGFLDGNLNDAVFWPNVKSIFPRIAPEKSEKNQENIDRRIREIENVHLETKIEGRHRELSAFPHFTLILTVS